MASLQGNSAQHHRQNKGKHENYIVFLTANPWLHICWYPPSPLDVVKQAFWGADAEAALSTE